MFRASSRFQRLRRIMGIVVLAALGWAAYLYLGSDRTLPHADNLVYEPRLPIETSGFVAVFHSIEPWRADAALETYANAYRFAVPRGLAFMDKCLTDKSHPIATVLLQKASLFHARGDTDSAYQALEDLEARIKGTPLEQEHLYTIIYYKGMTALRQAENDNCVMCRGQSACIFPIAPSAIHANPTGSRLAIKHFSAYLQKFPDDLEVQWLLNLAHMTLGQHPAKVEPRHRLLFDDYCKKSEFDIGAFRDVGHLVGVNRLNQSGGAVMEDFDNDGLLDFVVTSWAPDEPMALFRNKGDGTFEDRTKPAGLDRQTGGLYCVQTDFNNDGHMDVFIPRGSWLPHYLSQRPSLMRNNGDGTFSDVTDMAGLMAPTNSTSAAWADFDNDGFLDLFLCCQRQPCILYRNQGNGTFENVTARSGLPWDLSGVLGSAWIDFNNDGCPDLFVNVEGTNARLFRNDRDRGFTEVTKEMGIHGPFKGFSCWAFDFDNDGWLDLFASTFDHTLEGVVKGLLNQPHQEQTARLYRNPGGKGFQDITKEAGLDKVYSPMGSNFGDLDNDGYLDFYLGTGDPNLSTLVPNRLFRNIAGKRFAEITASSRMGHLQKGHGVAFGDWDRNGTQDVFIELGGAVLGDSYHNVLFQNPGHGNNWLSVKLIGAQTAADGSNKPGSKGSNRAAIGARIQVITAGTKPLTVHRHVTSGSSFGANPLEQHIGLGKADRVATLEIHWPTSGTTQVFHDIAVNQGLVVTEFAKDYQKRTWKPIALPE